MLKTSESINLIGVSVINGITVMRFSANIRADGQTNLNANINNQETYNDNKIQAQKDLDAFNAKVFDIAEHMEYDPNNNFIDGLSNYNSTVGVGAESKPSNVNDKEGDSNGKV